MNQGELLMNTVAPTLRMHEAYARELVADLDEAQMDASGGVGLENTPRFTLGHLCTGCAMTRRVFEAPGADRASGLDVPEVYVELFQRKGPADRRTPEASVGAPSRDELVDELIRQHGLLEESVRGAPDALLAEHCPWKLGHLLPTNADLVMFACSHEALHLGQLAAWRRAMGLPAAMARLIDQAPETQK